MSCRSTTSVSIPSSIAAVGRRVAPYSEWTGSPVASSRDDGTLSSSTPRMPCSGLNSATTVTPGALCSKSMVDAPVTDFPVWLVMRPTLRPFSIAKPSRASTSMPGSTRVVGVAPTGRAASADAPKSVPVKRRSRVCPSGGGSRIAEAATVATRARTAPTSPVPSGCRRLDRKITKRPVRGSAQSDVPVNPVWPNEPIGINSPRLAEKLVSTSQPRPRAARMPTGVAWVIIFATVSGASTRRGPRAPPASSMRTNRVRSRAVLKRPAWPATPPMRRAVGSCTTPRSGSSPGALHGQASRKRQRSVGAMRPRRSMGGRKPVSVMPSGSKT